MSRYGMYLGFTSVLFQLPVLPMAVARTKFSMVVGFACNPAERQALYYGILIEFFSRLIFVLNNTSMLFITSLALSVRGKLPEISWLVGGIF
ncbi:hypothetical protein SAMN04489724_4429 [Algoriphagus locisalis]|uniref:Uncharacterized protein n=1 Tax=Algoriphagus locisalis TaxID=305507 RepID=A0A1I7DV51_9BACT|nr:hypothetical protein SAMN04489724_4429 [Algoriphagus locisalis]